MALDLLDTPLRVTWDLHGGRRGMDRALARQVTSRLIEAQAFFITIASRPLLHDDAHELIADLVSAGLQVEVTTEAAAREISSAAALPAGVALTLDIGAWCEPGGVDGTGLLAVLDRLHAAGCAPACSLVPTRSNLPFLEQIFTLCQQAGVTRFKLPNLRIDDSFRSISVPQMVTPDDLDLLRDRCTDAVAFRCGLQLDVHDLFLWELLFPDGGTVRSEYGGCQAANSLAHVDLDAMVHPCVTWPQALGTLEAESFAAIWSGPARHEVRNAITAVPDGCHGCRDYGVCFGGCRGLSRFLPTPDGRDPMCRSRR